MTAECRTTQTPGTRAIKASKQLASSVSASAPLKLHVPVPMLKSMKETFAKSPSTSSSDASCGKRGLCGGKAISNRKISQGTKDSPGDARLSFSETSSETTGSEFEASNELSFECIEPDQIKRIIDVAEPSLLVPELQMKDLDVVHSNLVMSWFNVDDHEFDDFLKTKADQIPDMTGSKKQNSLSAAAEATVTPNSILESTNNEFEEAIGRVFSINTPLQDKKFEDDKVVVEELCLKSPDGIERSEGKNNFHKYEDEPALPETSEGTSDANRQEDTKHRKASGNLMGQEGHGIDAFRGWRAIKILLPSLFVLLTVLFCVDNLIEGELGMLPPPT